ncbi:MAG TPA: hypothetical protein VLC10_04885 [Patescibacteria group bacterium]|nr:hypothetical protein [Patescibacteria group bacterium]
MGNVSAKPVIAKAILLDRRERSETGRVLYVFLILDRDGKTVLDRPATLRTLREIVAFVIAYRRAHYGLPRVTFDAPPGIDREAGKFPRRYDALELSEIYYASSALGQS